MTSYELDLSGLQQGVEEIEDGIIECLKKRV